MTWVGWGELSVSTAHARLSYVHVTTRRPWRFPRRRRRVQPLLALNTQGQRTRARLFVRCKGLILRRRTGVQRGSRAEAGAPACRRAQRQRVTAIVAAPPSPQPARAHRLLSPPSPAVIAPHRPGHGGHEPLPQVAAAAVAARSRTAYQPHYAHRQWHL